MFALIVKTAVNIFCTVMILFSSVSPGAVTPNPVPKPADGTDARVMTFNLRYTGKGNTSVHYRQSLLISQVNEYAPDSVGFQEANIGWLTYLKKGLTDYGYVGRTRFDGRVLGEANPVFYRKDKYKLIEGNTFWLSKTPKIVGSKSWGSQNVRICTYALLENKITGERYVHFNTHLDNRSLEARNEQMKVVLNKIRDFTDKYPVILTGDFNDDSQSVMYSEVSAVLRDSRLIAPVTSDMYTFHNYGTEEQLIDYVFVSGMATPLVYHVIDDKLKDVYLSDHYGIYVDVKLN